MSSPDQLFAEAIACHQRKDYARAGQLCRQLLKRFPKEAGVLNLMGLVEMGEKRYPEAEKWIRKALAAAPEVPDFHANLGEALRSQGRLEEAVAGLSRAAMRWPQAAGIWHNLGYAHLNAGHCPEALEAARRSMAVQPRVEGFYVVGTALVRLGRYAEAEQAAHQGLRLAPEHPELLKLLGDTHYHARRYARAEEAYAAASARDPALPEPYAMQGILCQRRGDGEGAAAFYRKAMAAAPHDFVWNSSYLLNMLYQGTATPDAVFAEHRAFGERHGRPSRTFAHASRPPGARIRVAYLSADFRAHAVAYFVEGILRHHDRRAFEVFCYSDVETPDAATLRLASHVEHFTPTNSLFDAQLAERIHGDRIDILVDLGGHTAGGKRLRMFADRPAPVQATCIGYPATTGLPAMDYRLVDAVTDPEGVAERWHTEKLVRIPGCFLTYAPPAEAPEVVSSPAESGGGITFGCFNNTAKITAEWVGLVAAVLAGVPGSRCVFKSFSNAADDGTAQRLHAMFAAHGIPPGRIAVLPSDPTTAGHLARYGEVDIALDTFPYNGTTTTCEALWMGVPVVTLAGQAHVSRVGASLMTAVGLPDLAAQTPEEFVAKAAALAADLPRLAALRAGMRGRMADLTDGAAYTRRLEDAYRGMLGRAVAGAEDAAAAPQGSRP